MIIYHPAIKSSIFLLYSYVIETHFVWLFSMLIILRFWTEVEYYFILLGCNVQKQGNGQLSELKLTVNNYFEKEDIMKYLKVPCLCYSVTTRLRLQSDWSCILLL